MAENVKLEKEELEKLQIATDSLNKFKLSLGELEIQKLDLFGKINALTQEFTKMEQVLIEKYGKDSVINIKTGEVKKK
jgi:ABC-type phosphate transport system auxiliary subunit